VLCEAGREELQLLLEHHVSRNTVRRMWYVTEKRTYE
jgi:hypothetical protein